MEQTKGQEMSNMEEGEEKTEKKTTEKIEEKTKEMGCTERIIDIPGEVYEIERSNYYAHHYVRCNYQIPGVGWDQGTYYEYQMVYSGSYIEQNRISTGSKIKYWYYPFYTGYSCYGNYAYNKPQNN